MTTPKQEECTTEMAFGADIAALKLIFQVKRETLRQFQNQLIALRKEQNPITNVYAIQSLLFACREERAGANFAFGQLEVGEKFIEEIRRVRASESFNVNDLFDMPEENIK